MSKVCVLQHVASEPPGIIDDGLKSRGLMIHTIRVYRREPIPTRINDFSGLVVMGGPWACMRKTGIRFSDRRSG